MNNTASFFKLVNSPFKFRLFLLSKLPAAFFSGVRVTEANEEKCIAKVPYKWLTQNPFRSTYFACLSMAAEMSTGVLAMAHVYKREPAVSMLVLKTEAEFTKKATGITWFTCEDGVLIRQAIEEAVATGESRTVRALSTGRDKAGDKVAEFFITWTFKSRPKASD